MGSRKADRYVKPECGGMYVERNADAIQLLGHANASVWLALFLVVAMVISKASMASSLTISFRPA